MDENERKATMDWLAGFMKEVEKNEEVKKMVTDVVEKHQMGMQGYESITRAIKRGLERGGETTAPYLRMFMNGQMDSNKKDEVEEDEDEEEEEDGDGLGIYSEWLAIENFKHSVKSGMWSLKDVREKHSWAYARFRRFCMDYIRDVHTGVRFKVERNGNTNSVLLHPFHGDIKNEPNISMDH
jgi:hypothetical protein